LLDLLRRRAGPFFRHDEGARPECVVRLAQIKSANTTDKQVSDDEVEESPRGH
jgi:hypothetical protein